MIMDTYGHLQFEICHDDVEMFFQPSNEIANSTDSCWCSHVQGWPSNTWTALQRSQGGESEAHRMKIRRNVQLWAPPIRLSKLKVFINPILGSNFVLWDLRFSQNSSLLNPWIRNKGRTSAPVSASSVAWSSRMVEALMQKTWWFCFDSEFRFQPLISKGCKQYILFNTWNDIFYSIPPNCI